MKKIFYYLVATIYLIPTWALAADPFGIFDVAKYSLPTGKPTPSLVISTVINFVLSVLGVIAFIMIIVAGFQWMTAAGNEEKVSSAKKILVGAVIGLVIVMGSLVIVRFVVNNIITSLGEQNELGITPITACASPNSCKGSCDSPANDLGPIDCVAPWRCCAEGL